MQNGPSQGPREAAVPNAITVSIALLTTIRLFNIYKTNVGTDK